MALRIQGNCRPGGWFGCTAPFNPDQLAQLVTSTLSMLQTQGVENVILPASIKIALPPDGVRTVAGVLSHADNAKYGVLHWTEYSTLCMRRTVLEDLLKRGDFTAGDSYKDFVAAIRRLNLEVVDVGIL
jgi:hypothetical protein